MTNILDIERLEKLREIGGPELLSQMLDLYLENAPTRITGIIEGYQTQDFDRIAKSAHSLKSSSGNVGAMSFMNLCQQIEQAAEQYDRQALENKLTLFSRQADAVLAAVKKARENSHA